MILCALGTSLPPAPRGEEKKVEVQLIFCFLRMRCHFLVYFNASKYNALHHWIEHAKMSTVLKKVFLVFYCEKSSSCAKNPKNGCFLFVSKQDVHFP